MARWQKAGVKSKVTWLVIAINFNGRLQCLWEYSLVKLCLKTQFYNRIMCGSILLEVATVLSCRERQLPFMAGTFNLDGYSRILNIDIDNIKQWCINAKTLSGRRGEDARPSSTSKGAQPDFAISKSEVSLSNFILPHKVKLVKRAEAKKQLKKKMGKVCQINTSSKSFTTQC